MEHIQAPLLKKNIKFKIELSAQTSLLTSDVYFSAYVWDDISSNVGNIGIAIYVSGMSVTGFYSVLGKVYTNGTLGETVPRNSNGDIVSANSDWASVSIYMNTSSTAFSGASNPTTAAKKTFIHEVGHALKLSHPTCNSSLSGHVYDGYPYSVMNQGYPNGSYVASTITAHDKNNLKAKWGS